MRHDLNSAKLIEPKFGPKLFAPLRAQVSWYCYEDTGLGIVDQVLSNNQAGLDRLSKADLVREKVALYWIGENSTHGSYLVGSQLDTGGYKRRHALCSATKFQERQ
ncbi:hypothetical protein C6Q17_24290 [Burkholderia contaminans]|nr:hypothetical protein C6Q17_24290 [Burkholderia contaminans]